MKKIFFLCLWIVICSYLLFKEELFAGNVKQEQLQLQYHWATPSTRKRIKRAMELREYAPEAFMKAYVVSAYDRSVIVDFMSYFSDEQQKIIDDKWRLELPFGYEKEREIQRTEEELFAENVKQKQLKQLRLHYHGATPNTRKRIKRAMELREYTPEAFIQSYVIRAYDRSVIVDFMSYFSDEQQKIIEDKR